MYLSLYNTATDRALRLATTGTGMSRPGPSKQPQSDFARSVFSNNLRGEDAYARHVRYITQFQNMYGAGSVPAVKGKTEMDGLVERHRCVPSYCMYIWGILKGV